MTPADRTERELGAARIVPDRVAHVGHDGAAPSAPATDRRELGR